MIKKNYSIQIFPIIFFVTILNCNDPKKHVENYLDGNLKRTYYCEIDKNRKYYHQNLSSDSEYITKEIWKSKSLNVFAKGIYKEGESYSGTFIVTDAAPKCTTFHIEEYREGKLFCTSYPEWNKKYDFYWPVVDFAFRKYHESYIRDTSGTMVTIPPYFGYFNKNEHELMVLNEDCYSDWVYLNQIKEGYRFFIIPTFDKVILTKIILKSDLIEPCISYKMTNGSGGYQNTITKMIIDTMLSLTDNECYQIQKYIDQTKLWSTEYEYSFMCGDGTAYIFEGIKNNLLMYKAYSCTTVEPIEQLRIHLLEKLYKAYPTLNLEGSTGL